MIKILQYGEGNFLRAFAEDYFDSLNAEGLGEYSVVMIKPRPGSVKRFTDQKCIYNIVLRGMENGHPCERVRNIRCVEDAVSPFSDPDKYYSYAEDRELKIIISNTTEAGICFDPNDRFDVFETMTYPAKLTRFLYERFVRLGGSEESGIYILPAELIENNADVLKDCVDKYASIWELPDAFVKWNKTFNFYCNTLVDRIVSGYPQKDEDIRHIESILGEDDKLVTIAEPFGLWAVENKGGIDKYIKSGKHSVEAVLTSDIDFYKRRKVRILNGSHTNMVFAGLWAGHDTVYECMTDETVRGFVSAALNYEILPFVSEDAEASRGFADAVLERFMNPYLDHKLTSIALNSISKWRARVLPSFSDHCARHGSIPKRLTAGFSFLAETYRGIYEKDGEYFASIGEKNIRMSDSPELISYFFKDRSDSRLFEFMSDSRIWGCDLSAFPGFFDAVKDTAARIRKGEARRILEEASHE